MSLETLFAMSNLVVMPFWALMILLPHWSVTKRLIGSPLIVLPTALLYVALVLPEMISLTSSLLNPTLDGIAQLLATPRAALIAWAHFLTFDLFTGRWAYLESRAQHFSAWLMAPVLFFTFMLGPLGFVSYLILRYAYQFVRARKRVSAPVTARG